ncbi:hypothetical protein N7472_000199 [Penicillium cf. griseofulvum]|uniref:Uncharacterized protein n=1 Tax=Penicillium cf. griseofulvum TaxID=2972120 RepID=A0A9W9MZ84_9EURO|nr:hypothetical protein N7472_000199 [Penicillium cf. griseofulvum]
MSGRSLSDEFREEHANFWTLMEQIIDGLRNNYPANQDEIIGRMGQLNLQLSTLRRVGEMMGLSYPPTDIVRDAPPHYFSGRAQRHQNYFGTEFGYSCCRPAGAVASELAIDRDESLPRQLPTRNPTEQPVTIVHIDGPPYYTPGGPGPRTKTARTIGPVRTHPHIHLPAPTDTAHGIARQTRHRAVPYPGRGVRRTRPGNTRLTPPMPRGALPLPNIMQNGDASHIPVPTLPGVSSLFTPNALPGGVTLPGAPAASMPPPRGTQHPFPMPAPNTEATISVLNANVRDTLLRDRSRQNPSPGN